MEGTPASTPVVAGGAVAATAGTSSDAGGAGGDVPGIAVLGGGSMTEDVVSKARGLMRRIVASRPSPDPCLLHSLASILEQEESRFASLFLLIINEEAVLWSLVSNWNQNRCSVWILFSARLVFCLRFLT
jgi:hypothetical protein